MFAVRIVFGILGSILILAFLVATLLQLGGAEEAIDLAETAIRGGLIIVAVYFIASLIMRIGR